MRWRELRAVRVVFAFLLLVGYAGCRRKAPGPEECVRFAHVVVGVSPRQAAYSPKLKDTVDRLTVECLTTPYDHALISCVQQRGNMRACYGAFRARLRTPAAEQPRDPNSSYQ